MPRPPGLVTSIDVDRRVLAEAQEHLRAFPDRPVELLHSDGREGHPAGAPFDRIVVTAATPDLEPAWLRQLLLLLGAHGGFILLIGIVIGFPWTRHEPAPVIARRPVDPFGRQFIYFFAAMPALLATVAGVVSGMPGPVGGIAPLVALSGLAIVIAAGDAIAPAEDHASSVTCGTPAPDRPRPARETPIRAAPCRG